MIDYLNSKTNIDLLGVVVMKIKYSLHSAGSAERIIRDYLLLKEIEFQKWYKIVHLKLWRGVGLIMTQ